MTKAPEEGKIWEWRAFGKLSSELLARVSSLPVRAGVIGRPDNDIYFISPYSNHNIKIREMNGHRVLKLKLFVESGPDSIELYEESLRLVYPFPVSKPVFDEVLSLLKIAPPGDLSSIQNFGEEGLVRTLSACRPAVNTVEVPKTRSQYVARSGWIELADMLFPHKRTQSISVHSYQKDVVVRTLNDLDLAKGLKIMNYVQACRMWG